jgi:hypothetical protein
VKTKTKKRYALLIFSISLSSTYAQHVITTDGGQFTSINKTGNINYTVGQLVNKITTSSTGSLSEGVQQPFEISVVLGLEEAIEVDLNFLVYPNPSSGYLILSTGKATIENMHYQLYSLNGQLLETKKIETNETQINITNLENSIYFLKINQNNKEIKIFKLLKK